MNLKYFKAGFLEIFYLIMVLWLLYLSTYLIPKFLADFFGVFEFLVFLPAILFASLIVLSVFILIVPERKEKENFRYLRRLRIKKIKLKLLFICIGIWLAAICLQTIFVLVIERYFDLDSVLKDFAFEFSDYQIKHRITIYLLPIGIILIAFAEEIFWRGYLLPLQEKKWGKFSWFINGILWGLTHIFVYNFWSMIFIFLLIPYLGYKYKNTSITIIIHLLINTLSAISWLNSHL